MPTSLIAPIVAGAASAGVGSLFGGGNKTSGIAGGYAPTGISAGGLTSTFDPNGNISVIPDANRSGVVGNVAGTFGQQADAIGGLAARVAPGFSDMRAARLAEIENARQSSLSNLKDNLARRRVLGSSFGQDAVSRSEAEFGQQKAEAQAQSYLQELDMSNQLISQQFAAKRQQFQTGLDELNLEANVAAGLAGKASDQMGANARLLTSLNAQEAQLKGQFFGTAFKPAFDALGKGAGNLFKSGGNDFGSGYATNSIGMFGG